MDVIQIENLWKEYRLGVIGHGTLTHDLQSWWARIQGKDDPNKKIAPMVRDQGKQIDGDHFWALRDINFQVKKGEILGIIGCNGAGKSTLLKILSRVTAPSKGSIKIKGRIASLLEVGTGFHAELTGRENIYMNGAILGMSKKEINSKLDEIIDFSGVRNHIDTPVKRYSSGMYVRLAFAVAAHLEPEILVIDEVLAVGDMEFQERCLGKMEKVAKAGRTVLFVSHNMAAIRSLCSKSILLDKGKVKAMGSTGEVIEHYRLGEERTQQGFALIPVSDAPAKHTEIALLDSGRKPKETFDCDEEITVHLCFTVSLKLERLEIYFYVYDSHGHMLFQSTSASGDKGLRTFDAGEYVAEIQVPQLFLAPGKYSVAVGIQQQNLVCLQYQKEVIFFSVTPSGLPSYRMAHSAQLGTVLVDFPWTIHA